MPAASATPAIPDLPGVTHRYVTVNGVRLHYAEAGSGEPLVLIHGFPQNWYMWRRVIPELAKHYRVIAPDMRGAGWSDAPSSGYGKAAMADEIAAFMTAVGAPRARVMGHDWGGYIGFQLAQRHPEQVSQYLALNIVTPWPNPRSWPHAWRILYQPFIAAPVLGPALLGSPLTIRAMLWGASAVRDAWTGADIAAYAAPYADPAHAEAGSQMYRTFIRHELAGWARGSRSTDILQPQTLLLLGARDPVIRPDFTVGFERHARDMRVDVVAGAGHFIAEEQPTELVRRALAFFAGGDDARRGASSITRRP